MRIVIDLQGAQSASRFRGIGRYSLALTEALARNAGDHELWVVLNGAFDDVCSVGEQLAALIPAQRIRVFDPPVPVAEMVAENSACARSAELLREFFIEQLHPDAVLVTSLFEGYVDDAVTSVGCFIDGARTAVVLYDLIPYLRPDSYLGSPEQRQHYARKIDSLKRAGLLLAISDHARQEALDALGLHGESVITISTAVDERFCPGPPAADERLKALGITRPFVMAAPGGLDARKNIPGLLTAFSQLPKQVRDRYQLLIASGMPPQQETELRQWAERQGLAADSLVLSGYVDDNMLIALYRSTALFVFPSLHEGFGLPALEAMACGAPVIGADNSSIPEVIGLDAALFDGADPVAMAAAIERALCDTEFAQQLREHGRLQARRFSWDATAQRCLSALERSFGHRTHTAAAPPRARKLAFVSPLPPARSGIADYAAQLLPDLMRHAEITLIVEQAELTLPSELSHLPRQSAAWLMAHGNQFDHILYQFGNSPFHGHMFDLLEAHPGVVVLHDFFLSRVLAHEQMSGAMPGAWTDALYYSHGYPGLRAGAVGVDGEAVHTDWPCNLAVLQGATDIIVHSLHSKALGARWYGDAALRNWHTAPLPRARPMSLARADARRRLGIDDRTFLVCSFGFIAPTKLSDVLIDAWCASSLSADQHCVLVLVGENHGGAYGLQIADAVKAAGNTVRIAGWTDEAAYHDYLAAADAAVQLRSASRGETSAAVLDCMNYGLATIVNANGSMAELDTDAVCMLDDPLCSTALRQALERLHADPAWRLALGARASAVLENQHRPAHTAARYAEVLDQAWQAAPQRRPALDEALAALAPPDAFRLQQIAAALAQLPGPLLPRQLLIDVSTIAAHDLRSGIERVVRAQVLALLNLDRGSAASVRVEPVRLVQHDGRWEYRYAHAWTQQLLGIDSDGAPDHLVDVQSGDILFAADYSPAAVSAAAASGLYAQWRARGVSVQFQVFDLLPVLTPQFFPLGADSTHGRWLAAIVANADQLVCISAAVATELRSWIDGAGIMPPRHQRIMSLHLGADFDGVNESAPAHAAPARPAGHFLVVGTIEPRKGYAQTLAAFEQLWERDVPVTLTIVGSEGWRALAPAERRTIPAILTRLAQLSTTYPERLSWRQGLDDDALEQLYMHSSCLLAPSEGEGFGLPLIEAARRGLPVLARDLPVFREVGGDQIRYFHGLEPQVLAGAIEAWLEAHSRNEVDAGNLSWMRWQEHAVRLLSMIEDAAARDSVSSH